MYYMYFTNTYAYMLWIYKESERLLKYHGKQERVTGNHRFNIKIIR